MLIFKKSSRLKTLLISLISILSATLAISTFAWYSELNSAFDPDNVKSSVITQYFDSGTGTQNDPFVITRPIHYYRLVELQESNTFLVNGTPFADAELYFQFGKKDIDGNASTSDDNIYKFYDYDNSGVLQEDSYSSILNMNYYSGSNALPPLGSSEHPFKGHILGHNLTISNLHINGSGYSDIGVFGYVANGATISDAYFENPHIDAGGNSSSATSGTGHSSHSTHTYIGYLAGHVYNASATFSNVYINNCELTNTTGNPDEMINTYGYFGHVDFPSDVSADSASFAVEAKASDIYSAIDNSYSSATGNNVTTRDTYYTPSNITYQNAVTNPSSGTYSMGKYSNSPNYPYSLSTIGYVGGDTVTKHVRYYIGENNLGTLAATTTQLESEPADWSVVADGTYIFWDTTDQCWYYAVVESETSQQQQDITFNCFTISYVYNSTTYYLKYNNATLVATSTAPTSNTIDDYYFVFKPSAGSTGISELTSNSNSDNVYIYSPAHQKYLSIVDTVSTSQYTPTFVDDPTVQFVISGGPYTTFLAMVSGQQNGLFATTSVWSCRKVSTNTATTFTIGTPDTRQSVTGYTYNLATSVSDGDVVAIAAGYTHSNSSSQWDGHYVMAAQNSNQRSSDHVSVSNGVLTIGNGCDFLIATGSQTGTFNIIDQSSAYRENNSGYLYAAASNANQIKTNTQAVAGTNADATINIDASGYATIIFQGSNSRNHLYLNMNTSGSYPNYTSVSPIFSCYAQKSNITDSTPINGVGGEDTHAMFHLPKLYKKTTVYGASEDYSTATQKTYTSAAISEQNITEYGLRVAPLSSNSSMPSSYTTTNFDVNPSKSVLFNMNTSQVSYEATQNNYWAKVTTSSELTSGDKYLIVYESSSTSGYALDGSLASFDSANNYQSLTISSSTIAWSSTNETYSFTITKSDSKYYIKSNSGRYIGETSATTNSISNTTTENDANYLHTISINNGETHINGYGGSGYRLQYNTSGTRFRYYNNTQQDICLYKLIEADGVDATYIGDLVGDRYDHERIDVVGPVSYTSAYYNFTATSAVTANPTVGSKFYTTSYVNSGVTIIIDKTGSRDLGHLIFTYEDSNSTHIPYFLTNSNAHAVLNDNGARDVDGNGSDNVHSYLININNVNVLSLAYCGLDSSGNIVALNSNSVAQYVLVLGAHTDTHIRNVQYTFINAAGNVGNFGSVDYRTATYNSDGTLSTASQNEQVTSSSISIFYDVNTVDQTFTIDVFYNSSTGKYVVTASSSVTTTITIFIYNNTTIVTVNGTDYYGSEVITINAS